MFSSLGKPLFLSSVRWEISLFQLLLLYNSLPVHRDEILLRFSASLAKALSAPSCGRVGRREEEWSETCGLGKTGYGMERGPRAMPAPPTSSSTPSDSPGIHKRDQITTWKFWNNTVFFVVKYKIRSGQMKKKITAILYCTLIFQCCSAQKLLDSAVLIITLTRACNLKGA